MVMVLSETGERELAAEPGTKLWLSDRDLTRTTGWSLRPEGLCRGDVCLPLPRARERELMRDGRIDVSGIWAHMDRPALHSDAGDVWVLGDGARERNAALETLEAPDFTLPDFDGRAHSLSDFRGKKVLLITWASW